MTQQDDDDDDRGAPSLYLGDIGTIALAGVFLDSGSSDFLLAVKRNQCDLRLLEGEALITGEETGMKEGFVAASRGR